MKKSTKLLSVLLAVIMIFSSVSIGVFAAKTDYQLSNNLTNLGAYSPYGSVTRLSTEERLSILFDSLDALLLKANINMGVQGLDLGLVKIQVLIDFTSIDQALASLDTFYDKKGYLGLIGGSIGKLNLDNWQKGMSRGGTDQLVIAGQVLKLLSDNTELIQSVLDEGLNLGLLKNFIKVDLTAINGLITNLPGAIKGIVLPLMGRQDDDATQRGVLSNKSDSNDLVAVAQNFVNGLFTKPMNWTSYRVDAAGNSIGSTLPLPTTPEGTSRYFVISEDKTEITQYDYKYEGVLGDPKAGFVESVIYTKDKEFDKPDCTTYVYRAPEGYNGDATLKWYKAGDPSGIDENNPDTVVDANGRVQSSYWLPTVAKAFIDGAITLNLNDTDTVRGLVYKFAPYLFREMATTVLNGSAKKRMAEAFDVEFTKIGLKGDEAVTAEAVATGNPDNFFTKDQEYYVWEYSDYKVIDDVPYYRFQDEYFKGIIPEKVSAYYGMFNWNWVISDDFVDEFIPTSDGTDWALDNLNNLVLKAINAMVLPTWTVNGTTYERSKVFTWTEGGNDKLLNNLLFSARNFFNIAPEEIVNDYYADAQFYDAMMNGNINQAVNGLICELVKLIMPQIKFPSDIVNQPMTAIAAVVVRELCTQLIPAYNFDAMIYANYSGNAKEEVRTLASHTADEWLDITLYMGVNLGMFYLRNLADVGEDNDLGYYSVMSDLGAIPTVSERNTRTAGDAMTFAADSYKLSDETPSWLVAVDWIVDWALATNVEWAWKFDKLVNCGETVDLATYQNPFKKIDKVLQILPLNQIFNDSQVESSTYGSNTFLENILKGGIVDSIVNLDLPKLLSIVKIPDGSALRKTKIADNLVNIVADLLNSILYKVAGNDNLIDKTKINSVSSLLNQNNLETVVVKLIGKLKPAFDNGLLDPVLPIVNLFVGWKMDPQTYANPSIVASISDYLKLNNGSYEFDVTVLNNSSGMLLKHGDTYDSPYEITVDNIYLNGTDTGIAGFKVAPLGKNVVHITGSSSADDLLKITVKYKFNFKDGSTSATQLEQVTYVPATSKVSPVQTGWNSGNMEKKVSTGFIGTYTVVNFKAYTDTINAVCTDPAFLADTVNAIYVTWDNDRDSATTYKEPNVSGFNATYLASSGEVEARVDTELGKDKDDNPDSIQTDHPLKLKDNVVCTEDDTTLTDGQVALKSGTVIALGSASTKQYGSYNGKSGTSDAITCDFGNLYYCDLSGLNKLVDEELAEARLEANYTSTTWSAYWDAFKAAALMAKAPISTDNFATNYSAAAIKAKYDALKEAIKGLEKNTAATEMDVKTEIGNALDTYAVDANGADLNFQDYKLFEYWDYEELRNRAREINSSLYGPARPQGYIEGCSLSQAEIEELGAAVAGKKGAAIVDSMIGVPTADELAEFDANPFKEPHYDEVEIQDTVKRFKWYHDFMINNKVVLNKTFLDKEIAYANAQGYIEADYSKDSWAAYQEALTNANAVSANADALQSEVFNAKYELMRTQNALLLATKSAKETGAYAKLEELAAKAELIFANPDCYEVATEGMTEKDAYVALIKALGYKETDAEGNVTQLIYSRSAYDYMTYDRETNSKNMAKVANAEAVLEAAIKNFRCNILVAVDDATVVKPSDFIIDGITPGSITTFDELRTHVQATNDKAQLITTVSKANAFGTGAKVDVQIDGTTVATYSVVIYGDVNGDGAIDGIDTFTVDKDVNNLTALDGTYATAGDLDGDGDVGLTDYSRIANASVGIDTIEQKKS